MLVSQRVMNFSAMITALSTGQSTSSAVSAARTACRMPSAASLSRRDPGGGMVSAVSNLSRVRDLPSGYLTVRHGK